MTSWTSGGVEKLLLSIRVARLNRGFSGCDYKFNVVPLIAPSSLAEKGLGVGENL